MTIQDRFSRFLTAIELDAGRQGRIEQAARRLADYCRSDAQMSPRHPHIFYQGSYANDLAIKPAETKQEYDVDMVVLMSLPSAYAAQTLDWFEGRLALDADYRRRIIRKDKCVRLNYAGDFHVDAVPSHRVTTNDQIIQIPSRTTGWHYSHPKGFTEWCRQQNHRTNNDFSRGVKMLKRWRDITADAKTAVASIIFTTLLGPCVPSVPPTVPDAKMIMLTLSGLNKYLQARPNRPIVPNPSLPAEDLAADWAQRDYATFRNQILSAINIAVRAYQTTDELTAARLWRQLFGDDFPIY